MIEPPLGDDAPSLSGDAPMLGTVLVLEDDAGVNHLLRKHLERAGYRAIGALELTEARARLAADSIDLVVLDYQLGGEVTGLEFYRSLLAEGHELPAILVTGFGDEARLVEALRAGVRDYILKTPNFVELVAPTVERVMNQVRAERKLIETEAASRAKDEFLATLSHELRTPLTPVLAIACEMRHDERLPPDLRADMEIICRNIDLEARLIDDLLDLTRIVHGKIEVRKEHIDLRPLIEEAARTCCTHEAARKNIDCHLVLAEGPHPVHADASRLTQVLWNLLKNAVKFTPAGGQAWVRTRFEMTPAKEKWVVLEISDTGIGITPEALPRIFGAFEQGGRAITQRFGGLGLGLAISQAIADLHGGAITAASAGAGRGATFTLRLPLAENPLPQPTPAAAAPGARGDPTRDGDGQTHLLLVEDHSDTAVVMARMLRRSGYDVTVAGSCAQATAAVEAAQHPHAGASTARPIRLVISDLGLPDGTGHDLMRELRAKHRLRGIALSGFGMEEDVERARSAGFVKHLTKPVDFDSLARTVREVLGDG